MSLSEYENAGPVAHLTHRDRVLDRSMEAAMAAWSIYSALAIGLTAAIPSVRLTNTVDGLPVILTILIAMFLIIGNTSILRGLIRGGGTLRQGWRIERNGIVISGTGWLAYGTAVFITKPTSTLIVSLSIMLLTGYAFRLVDIGRKTKRNIHYYATGT